MKDYIRFEEGVSEFLFLGISDLITAWAGLSGLI